MRWGLAISVVLAGACSGEEGIIRVEPSIGVCPSGEATATCDVALDLGERPITVPFPLEVVVDNGGEGPLVVSGIGGTEVTSDEVVPFTVSAGGTHPVLLEVTPTVLGDSKAVLEIDSDDPARSLYRLDLLYHGVPKPVPRIELCAAGVCGVEIAHDFGLVRRTQRESVVVLVRNTGTAPLSIIEVEMVGTPSQEGEVELLTSTRPGTLEPGTMAEVILAYTPVDGVADRVELLFRTDDPTSPEARATIDATSDANAPPIADARQVETGSTSLELSVDDVVALDGSGSADPEGDPLRFVWTLTTPARSRAELSDSSAGLVTFVPDVAGSYRVELVVSDSLGQPSEVASVVLISARPRYAFRALLDWQGGGDLDLHLVTESGQLFGADDCHFGNPTPTFGAELRDDEEAPPGGEQLLFEAPPPGTYRLYVQYFDDGGLGASTANVQVVFDDASQPAFSAMQSLPTICTLWYVGDFSYPPAQFTPGSAPLTQQCR